MTISRCVDSILSAFYILRLIDYKSALETYTFHWILFFSDFNTDPVSQVMFPNKLLLSLIRLTWKHVSKLICVSKLMIVFSNYVSKFTITKLNGSKCVLYLWFLQTGRSLTSKVSYISDSTIDDEGDEFPVYVPRMWLENVSLFVSVACLRTRGRQQNLCRRLSMSA